MLVKTCEWYKKILTCWFNQKKAWCGVLKIHACAAAKHKIILSWPKTKILHKDTKIFLELKYLHSFVQILCRLCVSLLKHGEVSFLNKRPLMKVLWKDLVQVFLFFLLWGIQCMVYQQSAYNYLLTVIFYFQKIVQCFINVLITFT